MSRKERIRGRKITRIRKPSWEGNAKHGQGEALLPVAGGWKVKNERPEEKFQGNAKRFYSEEGKNYEKSAIRRIQEKLMLRALQFLELQEGKKILDAGCGTGIGMKVMEKLGYETTGIDVSEELLEKARDKELFVKEADMREIPFENASFDGIVSISALQWLLSGSKKEREANVSKVAKEFYRVLGKEGKAIIQFYPKSEEEMMETAKVFRKSGFGVRIEIESAGNAKKRKIFLILMKSQKD